MFEIGKYNQLEVIKKLDFGVYLDGGNGTEILLPLRYVPQETAIGEFLNVFIYHDNEGRLIATTATPKAQVGEFKFMEVKSVNQTGAFMDWGIMKDLLVPFSEQKVTMKEDRWYLVYVHLDHITKRVVGSAKIDKYLDNVPPEYAPNEQVNLLVYEEVDLGYKVIINNMHRGLIYRNEVYQQIEVGDELPGYIKQIREDDKIDVSIRPLGYGKIDDLSKTILEALQLQGGYIDIHDKSEPEKIYALFRCSKKSFKQAIGSLYKQKFIQIEQNGIRLIKK